MTAFVSLCFSGSGRQERQGGYSREGKLSNSSRASAAILAEVVHGGHSEGARRTEFAVEALAKSGRVTAEAPCERLQAICRKSFTLRHAPRWNRTKNASD